MFWPSTVRAIRFGPQSISSPKLPKPSGNAPVEEKLHLVAAVHRHLDRGGVDGEIVDAGRPRLSPAEDVALGVHADPVPGRCRSASGQSSGWPMSMTGPPFIDLRCIASLGRTSRMSV